METDRTGANLSSLPILATLWCTLTRALISLDCSSACKNPISSSPDSLLASLSEVISLDKTAKEQKTKGVSQTVFGQLCSWRRINKQTRCWQSLGFLPNFQHSKATNDTLIKKPLHHQKLSLAEVFTNFVWFYAILWIAKVQIRLKAFQCAEQK